MRSALRGIFLNAHNVLCMSGAAGDGRTINIRAHSHRLCGARPRYAHFTDLCSQIKADNINFWKKFNYEQLKDYHSRGIYPPQVTATILVTGLEAIVCSIEFEGCTQDSQQLLNTELMIRPAG